MPQVASDSTIYSHNSTTPRQARPAQQPDRAASSPFESLLDDSASTPPPPPTASDNKTAPADESRASSNTTDCKAPPANDGTAPKKTAEETDGQDNTSSDGIKATLGAVVTEGASGADEGKPVADKKPTVTAHPDGPKTDQSADSDQATTANDFVGLIAAPAAPATPSRSTTSMAASVPLSLAGHTSTSRLGSRP